MADPRDILEILPALSRCPQCGFDVAAALREPIPLAAWFRHPFASLAQRWRRWRYDTPAKNQQALVWHTIVSHGASTPLHELSASAHAAWENHIAFLDASSRCDP